MGNPLPALAIQPPPDPLRQIGQAIAIKNAQQEGQTRQLQNQILGSQIADQQKMTDAYARTIANGGSSDDLMRAAVENKVSGQGLMNLQNHITESQAKLALLTKDQLANVQTQNDMRRGQIMAIRNGPESEKQTNWANEIQKGKQEGWIPQDASNIYPGDDKAEFLAAHFATGSQLAKEAAEKQTALGAQQRGQAAMGELDLNRQKFAQSPEELARRAASGDTEAQSILDYQNKQAVSQAGAKAGAEAKAKFPFELALKQQENANNPVFAVNPQTKQRELTTVGDAQKMGYTNPVKASQTDIEKETQLNAQMNELQLNTSRFKSALNAMGSLSKSDVAAMTHILSDPNVNNAILNTAGMPAVMSMIEQGGKASDWNSLSPDKQDALMGALRMKNSALLFQKVATGMGRASKEAMDIEIANMPSPIEGATVGNKKLQAFQENIDQMSARSVKLPWMDQPQDVKARLEQQAVDAYNAAGKGKYPASIKPSSVYGRDRFQVGDIALVNGQMKKVTKVYPNGSFDAE